MRNLVCVLTILLQTLLVEQGKAQSSFTFHPIISEGLQVTEEIESAHPGVDVVSMTFDIADEHNYTYLRLESEVQYVFEAFADNNIVDLAITVNTEYKGELTEITSASEFRNKATLRFNPEREDTYVIDIKVNKFKEGKEHGHYGIVVCKINRKGDDQEMR